MQLLIAVKLQNGFLCEEYIHCVSDGFIGSYQLMRKNKAKSLLNTSLAVFPMHLTIAHKLYLQTSF